LIGRSGNCIEKEGGKHSERGQERGGPFRKKTPFERKGGMPLEQKTKKRAFRPPSRGRTKNNFRGKTDKGKREKGLLL